MTKHSDFLLKISSTTTPRKGRKVLPMDEIIVRELSGRCLDEANVKPIPTNNLINRLFGSPPKPSITATQLNARYRTLVGNARNADDEATAPVQTSNMDTPKLMQSAPGDEEIRPAQTSNVGSPYNLRPRKAKQVRPAVDEAEAALPAPNSDSQVVSSPIPVLYDTKARVWNLTAVKPGDSDILAMDCATLQQFEHPKPPALHTGTSALVDSLLDGPTLGGTQPKGNPVSSGTGPSQLVSRKGDQRDVEVMDTGAGNVDEVLPSSLENSARQGAGYDGQEKDYSEGAQKKRKKGEPSKQVPQEAQWAAFLNTLAIISSPPGSSRGRQWHHIFANKPLPSEEGEVQWNRKPDLVLLEHQENGHLENGITWRSIKALAELTTSKLEKNTTLINTLRTKAYILLCSQPWRRYVLAFSIADVELRVHLFDRSGVVTSSPVNFHTNIAKTCHIIQAFAHADNTVLGFDLTLEIFPLPPQQPSSPYIGTLQVDDTTYFIVAILWTSNGFIGRCTNIFHVRPQGAPPRVTNGELDKFDYVVKDCWLEEHLIDHEEHIYGKISGVAGVPSLVKAWTIQYQGSDDTTLHHRPTKWDLTLTPRYATRFHRRLLMTPVGSPLSSFRSQRELLNGLIRGLEIHEHLVREKGILHRDISPNNMVFERSNQPGERSLLVIDFDYAVCLDGSTTQYPKGTGTLPFVSLAILRQVTAEEEVSSIVQEVADDLESFFYVFTWICVLYNGPNGALSLSEDHTSIVHGWGEAAIRTGGLDHVMHTKNTFVHAPNRIIEEQFTPYFQNLRSLARKWRKLVKREDRRRMAANSYDDTLPSDDSDEPASVAPYSLEPLTHQTIINLIRRYAKNLPTVDPSPQIPPGPP